MRDMKMGVLFRLTFCLVVLHGSGHVSSEEMNGGYIETRSSSDAGPWPLVGGAGSVVVGGGSAMEGFNEVTFDLGEVADRVAEWNEEQLEGIGRTVDRGVGKAIKGDDKKVEGGGKESGKSVKGDVEATKRVDEGAGEVVDETGEVSRKIGECVGTRFKKCR